MSEARVHPAAAHRPSPDAPGEPLGTGDRGVLGAPMMGLSRWAKQDSNLRLADYEF